MFEIAHDKVCGMRAIWPFYVRVATLSFRLFFLAGPCLCWAFGDLGFVGAVNRGSALVVKRSIQC